MTSENKESIQPISTLRELLVKSTLSPTVSIPNGIKKIDLGIFGQEAEGLLERSIKDPKGLERGKILYVTPDGGIQLQIKDVIGSKHDRGQSSNYSIKVGSYVNRDNLPRYLRQDRFFAGVIHSHGLYDVPPSPADLSPLFRNVDSPAVAPMLFVITTNLKCLYFKGKNTPQWNEDQVQEKVAHWENLIYQNVHKKSRPGMSPSEWEGINARSTHNFIRSVKEKYDLKLYSCPIDKNIAIEESA